MATLITPGKKQQLIRFATDAARKAGEAAAEAAIDESVLDDPAAQRVIERGDEFAAAVRAAVHTTVVEQIRLLSERGRYAREVVASTFDYPGEYTGLRPIRDQIADLVRHFPELDPKPALAFVETRLSGLVMPPGMEGPVAIPLWEQLAATYGAATERLIAKIRETCADGCRNYCEGALGDKHLEQHERTMEMLARARAAQPGDILVLWGQFGKLYRGHSTRRVNEIYGPTEFGGYAPAIGAMILTHSTRFVRWEQLHVDCPGDKYAPEADGRFGSAPVWNWSGGKLEFDAYGVDCFDPVYGSVSFCLPE